MKLHAMPSVDRASLIKVLEQYAGQVQPSLQLQQCAAESFHHLYFFHHGYNTDVRLDDFVAALSSVSGLAALNAWGYRGSPNTAGGPALRQLASWLLAQLAHKSPADITLQLNAFLERNSVELEEVLILWGLNPQEPVDLGRGIRLVPTKVLRPHPITDLIHQIRLPEQSLLNNSYYTQHIRPRAALVRTVHHEPILLPQDFSSEAPRLEPDLQEVVDALPLLRKGPISPVFHYFAGPVELPFVGAGGWSGQEIRGSYHFDVQESPISAGVEYVRCYVLMNPVERKPFRIALASLATADELTARGNGFALGRAAVEIGMALESVLSEEGEGNDSLSFKVQMRGASWLGGVASERLANMRALKDIYSMRSKVAHGGELKTIRRGRRSVLAPVPWGGEKIPADEALSRSGDLCGKIIGTLISNRAIADWNRFVLTGEKTPLIPSS